MPANKLTLAKSEPFVSRVLAWFKRHGRHDLPWQQNKDPYRIWVSEIMLQQTQVSTVIPYYLRFMQRFETITALAQAEIDEVLHYWSGLGYYARARNLHKAAKIIQEQHKGIFPLDFEAVEALPGIGKSTAGAILALSDNQRYPILDGNVKRVLARFAAVSGWPGSSQTSKQLWQLADYYTPQENNADYTQAMMDLGALICTRRHPKCQLCPVSYGCIAWKTGQQHTYPEPKPKRNVPIKATRMVIVQSIAGEILLEQRPPVGIWGGLWSFPECNWEQDIELWCQQYLRLNGNKQKIETWEVVPHRFTHFQLNITPVLIRLENKLPATIMESKRIVWYNIHQPDLRGLAVPVRSLLQQLNKDSA